jgi:hypothetical protein
MIATDAARIGWSACWRWHGSIPDASMNACAAILAIDVGKDKREALAVYH